MRSWTRGARYTTSAASGSGHRSCRLVAAEVDPETRFGQPRIPGIGIPTAIIYERWRVGEAAEQLAAVYERSVAGVNSAISYEESSRAVTPPTFYRHLHIFAACARFPDSTI